MSIISHIYKAQQVAEGAGVLVNRVFGHGETDVFDPFLMLDFFDEPAGKELPGFPWHPHKGIETISYFIKGAGEHQDSMGNKGVIRAGELQWMSAGKGIMHQEMPSPESEGATGFQFWLNLPRAKKLKEPEYQYIRKGEMKEVTRDGMIVKVIAGSFENVVGPIDKSDLGVTMLHIILEPGSSIQLTRDDDKQGFVFAFDGNGSIQDESAQDESAIESESVVTKTAYTLNPGTFSITATSKLELIYAEGKPLKEPIAWYGPVVMNTREEIVETFQDIENGRFV